MAAFVFRPPLWAIAATAAGCALFAALGTWQLHRGQAKQALIDQYAAAPAAPLELRGDSAARDGELPEAAARGTYLPVRQLLLDNQSHDHQPGYHVWTPLRLERGGLLLVNRGWIPLAAARQPLPAPEGAQAVRGRWRSLPRAGMQLEQGACVPAHPGQVVNYPDATQLACLLGEPVAAGELLLDAAAPGGYVRDWHAAFDEFPPQRHYAYAAQWFAFAATALAVFIRLNLKRVST
ncbi:MAG TPA: SURF1 family protein [Nevskiaceae bacterium]|nr:SURF1 family protein [Nevskiaceae bacterium]